MGNRPEHGGSGVPGYLDATEEWTGPRRATTPSARGRRPGAGAGAGRIRGQARGVQFRTEQRGPNSSIQVLTFRVERYGPDGERLGPVPVEIRGHTLDGQLAEGEDVELSGRWRRGTLRAAGLTNLTTGAVVKARGQVAGVYAIAVAAVVLFVIGIGALVGYQAVVSSGVRLPFGVTDTTVPAIVGVDLGLARADLDKAGLRFDVYHDDGSRRPFGEVIRTEPAAGSVVGKGSVVRVYISTGSA